MMTGYGRARFAVVAAALTAVGFFSALALAGKAVGDLTGPWQLLIDDYLVASKSEVVRKYHAFEKYAGNPILTAEKPWENEVVTSGAILPGEDGTGYRMWHYCWTPKVDKQGSRALYSTSKDGIHWERPVLGLVPWVDGSLENNFLPQTVSPMYTPGNPEPKRRYTSISGCKGGYCVRYSEDGIHWEDDPEAKPLTGGGDVGLFHYDPNTEQYLGYVKIIRDVSGLRRRCVGLSATKDPRSWPPLELVMAPDDFDDRWVEEGTVQRTHFYGCRVFTYETMYLGLLWVFRAEDERGYFHGPVFIELVSSRDGIHWQREEGERPPILNLGDPPSWDQGMLYTSAVLLEGETIKVYYTGSPDYHDVFPVHGGVGLATLRKDGFVSLDAGSLVGTIQTKRLANAGGALHINYKANATGIGGYIAVAVLDADGGVIPGYGKNECDAIRGDSLDHVVTWGEKKELPTGSGPIRLQFYMKDASLYSFMAGEKVEVIDEPAAGPTLGALYTFENDQFRQVADVLEADGRQGFVFRGYGRVDTDAENAAFGQRSLELGSPFRPLNRVEIEGTTELGTRFTLAAMVKSSDNGHARLFSAYDGGGPVNCDELFFDFDPQGKFIRGMRLHCKGIGVESEPVTFADGKYHHVAVTYDDGEVRFYLDGKPVGRDRLPGGAPVVLKRDLLMGEDAELGSHEQLSGHLDDILVVGRALGPEEIGVLSSRGAAACGEMLRR
jgi:hypothetical protein